MKKPIHSKALVAVSSLVVLLTLGACGERGDGQTVGQKIDAGIARTGEAAREVKQDTKEAAAEAKQETKEAAASAGAAVGEVKQDTKEAAASAGSAAREAKDDARTAVMGAAADTKAAAAGAADKVGAKVDDAQITTSVNAGLAADKDLGATQIDVDTKDGVVTLTGSAPSATAKSRASEIVRNVKDVKSVNNQLTVKAG